MKQIFTSSLKLSLDVAKFGHWGESYKTQGDGAGFRKSRTKDVANKCCTIKRFKLFLLILEKHVEQLE